MFANNITDGRQTREKSYKGTAKERGVYINGAPLVNFANFYVQADELTRKQKLEDNAILDAAEEEGMTAEQLWRFVKEKHPSEIVELPKKVLVLEGINISRYKWSSTCD